jgi:hypothetical protein
MKEKPGYKIIRKCCNQWEEVGDYMTGAWFWIRRECPYCPFCGSKIKEEQVQIKARVNDSDDYDDHTSVWGGAGPDCSIGRREAA